MIPQQLTLKNFMCYQDVTVDFAGLHLTCLSGSNGSGKSALLAGITWALWGKARDKVADDDLVGSGAIDMSADFAFQLGRQQYKVLRTHTRKFNSRTTISLQIFDEPTNSWRSLNERGVRETQSRIIEILHMDYETFINSAFLVQGRADEFTRKAPGERKNVLANILGLDYYDKLQEKAKREFAACNEQVKEADGWLARLDQELATLPALEQNFDAATSRLLDLDEQLEGRSAGFEQLRRRFETLEGKHEELVALAQAIHHLQAEREAAESQLRGYEQRLTAARETLRNRDAVQRGYTDLRRVQDEVEAGSDLQSRYADLSRQLQQTEFDLANERKELERDLKSAHERANEVERKAASIGRLTQELEQQQQLLADFELLEQQQAAADQRRQELQRLLTEARTEIKTLKAEMDRLRETVRLIKASDHQQCPVCGNALQAGDLDRIEQHYTTEGVSRKRAVTAHEQQVAEFESLIAQSEQEANELSRRIGGRRLAEKQAAAAELRLREATDAGRQLADLTAQVDRLEQRLREKEYAQAARVAQARLQAAIAALGYDAAAYAALRAQLQGLRQYEAAYDRLRKAEGEEQVAQLGYIQVQAERNNKQAAIAEREKNHQHLASQLSDYEARKSELERARYDLEALRRQREMALREHTQMESAISRLYDIRASRVEKVAERDAAAHERTIYEELVTAFGKKGVQAMIIESAIPELEDESNDLLGRMTDGKMQVKFITQRDTRRGDSTVETLDLEVAHNGNYRSYELYSGGEAFRINFAIRIAMSKLLAHRAGARLQTLIIDEGFGTQDGDGRERVVQAIQAIKEDFECIFVITHIEELKESFPARIEVRAGINGVSGSSVEVVLG